MSIPIKLPCLLHKREQCSICYPTDMPRFYTVRGEWHYLYCLGTCGITMGCAAKEQLKDIAKSLRHRTSSERKAEPIHAGVLMYFPDALAAVARVSMAGNKKHNPGEPLHWSRGKSTDQMNCAARHMLTPEEIDPDTGEVELANAAWRILAELQLVQEKRLAAEGIIPYSGVV